ncbi:hypothetical protein [Chitinophaga sp. RAB17]|uniref:hypothetical protein n=1 Tax=Chitinophaga sp. RAB17 TaxID=3233049 RepID=UPI003F907672
MFGNNNPEKQLFFRKPFSEKYTLTIKADVLAGSMPIKTTTEIRWNLQVIKVEEDLIEIELITLDNELLATNNPALKDLARMNQAFARMYNEIHVLIDRSGKVKKVLNEELIKRKWASTKAEMQAIENQVEAVKGIIILNDEIFTSPEKIVTAVQNNEFFSIYFHHVYGRKLPGDTPVETRWNHFQQAQVDWSYSIRSNVTLPVMTNQSSVIIDVTGYPVTRLDNNWIKKAYSAFQNVDTSQIKPHLTELGKYNIDPQTGRLKEAYLLKEEIAHPQFIFSKMEYTMKAAN